MTDKKLIKKTKFGALHRFTCAISLITFVVIIVGGVLADVRFVTITIRAAIALIVIALISRVVLRVVASYEEMNGGKA